MRLQPIFLLIFFLLVIAESEAEIILSVESPYFPDTTTTLQNNSTSEIDNWSITLPNGNERPIYSVTISDEYAYVIFDACDDVIALKIFTAIAPIEKIENPSYTLPAIQ